MAAGREPVHQFLQRQWTRELDYRLIDDHGFMQRRFASIDDLPIRAEDRRFHWPPGRRPDEHPGLDELGL